MLRKFLKRVGIGAPLRGRGQPAASAARSAADAARDRGAFREAADCYRRHVEEFPGDFGIWVQLGHMRKEAGDLVGADEAYRRAMSR